MDPEACLTCRAGGCNLGAQAAAVHSSETCRPRCASAACSFQRVRLLAPCRCWIRVVSPMSVRFCFVIIIVSVQLFVFYYNSTLLQGWAWPAS
jgi:hypothetical protein